MAKAVGRWLLWNCLFSVLPILILLAISWADDRPVKPSAVLGHGELLIVVAALGAQSLALLHGMPKGPPIWAGEVLGWIMLVVVVLSAALFGSAALSSQSTELHFARLTQFSIIMLVLCGSGGCMIAALAAHAEELRLREPSS